MVKIKFEDKIKRNIENTNTNRRTLKREKKLIGRHIRISKSKNGKRN